MILTTRHTWEAVWGSLAGPRLGLTVGVMAWLVGDTTDAKDRGGSSNNRSEYAAAASGCGLPHTAARRGCSGRPRMSKNSAWLMIAFTLSAWNGLVMRNVGSGRVAGQQPLRVGRHEDHRHRERAQDLVDGIEAGAAVREQDVGQHQTRTRALDGLDGLPLGAGDLDDAMPESGDEPLQVERDQRLVLDDHHVGGDLPGDLAACLVDQVAAARRSSTSMTRAASCVENSSTETSRNACRARGVKSSRLRWAASRPGVTASPDLLVVPLDGAEDLQECAVEGNAGRQALARRRRDPPGSPRAWRRHRRPRSSGCP